MLCKRPTKKIEDSVKEMGGGEFIIEEKLDGERMQLHKRGNEYFYCSRSVSSSMAILVADGCSKERQRVYLPIWCTRRDRQPDTVY